MNADQVGVCSGIPLCCGEEKTPSKWSQKTCVTSCTFRNMSFALLVGTEFRFAICFPACYQKKLAVKSEVTIIYENPNI